MEAVELRVLLESLKLSCFGYEIQKVELEIDDECLTRCSVTGRRSADEDPFVVYVMRDERGQISFTSYIYYEKSTSPDVVSAALVELCNELNMLSVECCAKLEFHPEREGKYFNVVVALAFVIPLRYYSKKSKVTRDLCEHNLRQFLDNRDYYYNELGFMLGKLSAKGLFDDESDADDDFLSGRR